MQTEEHMVIGFSELMELRSGMSYQTVLGQKSHLTSLKRI